MGVPFNRTPAGKIAQRAFGGHTRNFGQAAVKRACYAADRTGRVILDTLWERALQMGIRFFNEFQLIDLIVDDGRCCGVVAYELATGSIHVFHAKAVLLATGGAGKIYKTTSNALASTGDGMAIAYRAGAPLEDMEFVQFHPTGLYKLGILDQRSRPRRGRGSAQPPAASVSWSAMRPRSRISPRGTWFHAASWTEVRAGRGIDGKDYVHLDLTHLGADVIGGKTGRRSSAFAQTYARCRRPPGTDPGSAHLPLHDGRNRGRRRRARDPGRQRDRFPRPLRRRRMRLRLGSRRQPPGLQLAARHPGLRPAFGQKRSGGSFNRPLCPPQRPVSCRKYAALIQGMLAKEGDTSYGEHPGRDARGHDGQGLGVPHRKGTAGRPGNRPGPQR